MYGLDASPDGRRVLAYTRSDDPRGDGSARVWDTETSEPLLLR